MRAMCHERLGDAARSARRQMREEEAFTTFSPTVLSLAFGMVVARGWAIATAAGQAVSCSATTRTRPHSGLQAIFAARADPAPNGCLTSATVARVQ